MPKTEIPRHFVHQARARVYDYIHILLRIYLYNGKLLKASVSQGDGVDPSILDTGTTLQEIDYIASSS